jgi:TatD DNase family protein
MLQLIDSHAHLYLDQFDSDRADVVARAQAKGIHKIVLPNIDLDSIAGMEQMEMDFPGVCYATMGLHPCSAETNYAEVLAIMEKRLSERKYTAIGETGIDLHWDKTYFEEQKRAFRIQLQWAKDLNIPIIIHSRESTPECIAEVKAAQDGRLKGVFHCFGGGIEEAQQITDLGMHLGIGGVATYKKAGLDQVLPKIGLDRVILETDAPYLAPVPHRGKRNESAYVRIVAEQVSEILIMPLEKVGRITTANSIALFELDLG